jgi:peptidoglycan/LPS O-acetylase OafA/YrhL
VQLQVIYTTQLPGTLDAFGMGIALAILVFKGEGIWFRYLLPSWRNCLVWLVSAVGLLFLAGALFLPSGEHWTHSGAVIFWRTLLACGFGAALAATITCPIQRGFLLQPARYLGQISYGIYLWHFPVLLSLLALPGLHGVQLFMMVLIGSVLLASLSWHLFEKHWLGLRR